MLYVAVHEVTTGISVVKTRWPRLGEQEMRPERKDAFAQNTAWPHPCNTVHMT